MSITNVTSTNTGGPKKQLTLPKKGPRPALLTGIIDIGVHTRSYQGELKKPCREFVSIFTLVETYELENGDVRNFTVNTYGIGLLPGAEKAKYKKFHCALDPDHKVIDEKGQGDLTSLIGKPCFVNIVHSDPDKDGIQYVRMNGMPQQIPEDYPIGHIDYQPLVFDMNNPDKEVFQGLRPFFQDMIRESEGYAGSDLETYLDGEGTNPTSSNTDDSTDEDDQDSPI